MSAIARRLVIHGRVQGVWYRAWTVETAQGLGLVGWVRNRRDGTVEAWVQGEAEAVERMISAANEGPPNARVERIGTEEVESDDDLYAFEQLPTV